MPKILPFSFGDAPSFSEQYASVQCRVSEGDIPLEFIWLFNGQNLTEFMNIEISKTGKRGSVLNIESINANHAGMYTCLARNDAGNASYSAELKVNGVELS